MTLLPQLTVAAIASAAGAVAFVRALGRRPSIPSAGPSARNPEAPMFRISQIFQKVVTAFHDAETAIEDGAVRIYQLLPDDMKSVVDGELSIAKQYVSDAITQADQGLARHQQAIALGVEEALDTELALLTRGVSVPYNALTNHAVDAMVATAIAAAHNAGLSIKARLASGTALQLSPASPPAAVPA